MAEENKQDNNKTDDQALGGNARYWAGVLYPENMVDGWEDDIGDTLQVPYSYVIHDKDVDKEGQPRKTHVDMILAFPNTTTYKHALGVFNLLSKPGCKSINTCQRIVGVRHRYDYQIHDTDDCRKKHKHQYDESERHTGNGFDIGAYEQVSVADKERMAEEIADLIYVEGFTNFMELRTYVRSNMDQEYSDVLRGYNSYLEKLTKANYQLEKVGKLTKGTHAEDDKSE